MIPLIGQAIGRELIPQPDESPPGATPRRAPDIGKIGALGYRPAVPLREGLPRLVEWYAANRRLFAQA